MCFSYFGNQENIRISLINTVFLTKMYLIKTRSAATSQGRRGSHTLIGSKNNCCLNLYTDRWYPHHRLPVYCREVESRAECHCLPSQLPSVSSAAASPSSGWHPLWRDTHHLNTWGALLPQITWIEIYLRKSQWGDFCDFVLLLLFG